MSYFYETNGREVILYLNGKEIKRTTQRTPFVRWFIKKAITG